MYTIRQILQRKGNDIWSVSPQTTNLKALELLAEKDIGALLVMDGKTVVGIISERDFVRQIAREGAFQLGSPVSESMTRDVIALPPDKDLEECMAVMTANRIRHLPVVENNEVIGIISIGDVVKSLIEDREDLIHNLENYILGTGYGR